MPPTRVAPSARPSVDVIVAETVQPLKTREFAHFLYLFRVAYVRALELNPPAETIARDPGPFLDSFTSSFHKRTAPLEVANLFNTDLEDDELEILKLSKSSPLEMVIVGSIAALVVAVILSGGRVEFKPYPKFTLPPLGVGIKSLREAFRLPPNKTRRKKLK